MKQLMLTIFTFLLFFQSFSQAPTEGNTYIKLSGGRISFGSGDILGYSIGFDASKNVIKKSRWSIDKLLLGAELILENGVKNPVVINSTFEEFQSKTFYHTSNALLWPKASYYPFNKMMTGFNIQVGPTFGYSYRSIEIQAKRMVDLLGNSVRQSTLFFDNGFTVGYRISTGIEFELTQKLLTGFRLDFSNNTEGEINTLLAVKAGIRF